jgi:hypothetical protein
MSNLTILDPRLRHLIDTFEYKVRYAAEYHGVQAGQLFEEHGRTKRTFTIPIFERTGSRRIGEVSHVQAQGTGKHRGRVEAYTVTRLYGPGSVGERGIMLGWLKNHDSEARRPKLRVVTAADVLGRKR